MNRIFACVLLSLGTVLVVYGLNALDSLAASFSRVVQGHPPGAGLWFLVGGMVAAILGVVGLFRAPNIRPAFSRPGGSTPPQARRRSGNL